MVGHSVDKPIGTLEAKKLMVFSALVAIAAIHISPQSPDYREIALRIRETVWRYRLDLPAAGNPPVHIQHEVNSEGQVIVRIAIDQCWLLLEASSGKLLSFSTRGTGQALQESDIVLTSAQAKRVVDQCLIAGGYLEGLAQSRVLIENPGDGTVWNVQGSTYDQGFPHAAINLTANVDPTTGTVTSLYFVGKKNLTDLNTEHRTVTISLDAARLRAFSFLSSRSDMSVCSLRAEPLLCWWQPRNTDDDRFEPLPAYFAELARQNKAVLMYKVTFNHGTRCWNSEGVPIYCEAYVDPQTGEVASAIIADFGFGGSTMEREVSGSPWPSVGDDEIGTTAGKSTVTSKGRIEPVSEVSGFVSDGKAIVSFGEVMISAEYDSRKNRLRTKWGEKWVYGRPSESVRSALRSLIVKAKK